MQVKRLNRSVLMALGLATAATLWMASGLFSDTVAKEASAPAPSDAPFKVVVQDFEASPLQRQVVLQGQVDAYRTLDIKAEGAGRVEARLVKEGERVQQGDVILKLEVDNHRAALQQAQAQLRLRTLEREASESLHKQKLLSNTEYQRAVAMQAEAEALVALRQVALEHTEIRAPFDGVVNRIDVEQGSYLQPGDVIGQLVDQSRIVVHCQVPQHYMSAVAVGSQVEARLLNGGTITAKVTHLSLEADNQTRSYRLEAIAENAGQVAYFGQSAAIEIDLQTVAAHQLPHALLEMDDLGHLQVKGLDPQGLVQTYPVDIVQTEKTAVWVSGLPNPVKLITRGQGFVFSGQNVDARYSM